jgi:hypothetical protein
MPRRISRPGASEVSTISATRGRDGRRLVWAREAREVRRRTRRQYIYAGPEAAAALNLQEFRFPVTRAKRHRPHARGAMDDPGLWLTFAATVVFGYLLFAAIERRQLRGRR